MGLDRVGIEDQFEDLGGTSLLAASIFAEIEKMFGVTAPMAMLVEAPTVQELAQRIDDLVQSSRG
jgi:aspartate racemase